MVPKLNWFLLFDFVDVKLRIALEVWMVLVRAVVPPPKLMLAASWPELKLLWQLLREVRCGATSSLLKSLD